MYNIQSSSESYEKPENATENIEHIANLIPGIVFTMVLEWKDEE